MTSKQILNSAHAVIIILMGLTLCFLATSQLIYAGVLGFSSFVLAMVAASLDP